MAIIIPDILPNLIENDGEKLFYSYASNLPAQYTVLYSYKYQLGDEVREKFREADFVIVHPSLGYAVVEVKQGEVSFHNGQWHELKNAKYMPMDKDPVEQAKTAMFGILQAYQKETKRKSFPLGIRFALCFPECAKISGTLPQNLKSSSIWTFKDNLQDKIQVLFAGQEKRDDSEKFSTIRSFKGLEADVVFVIGVKDNDRVCTPADVYVGASRARFLLHVFHHQDWRRSQVTE